jgi:Peptidase C10 family/Spi protease inhibitor/Secretion system C-terminal sorting domain
MKKINIIALLILISCSLFAKRVDMESAKIIAKNYYVLQVKEIKGLVINAPVITETIKLNKGKGQQDLIYVFNFQNGFVMVAADDAVTPILGFSIEGKYTNENQPPAFVELMESYKEGISNTIKSSPAGTSQTVNEWKNYLTRRSTRSGSCTIWPKFYTKAALLSTTWDQGCYYNEKCPYDTKSPSGYCSRVPAGCVAVAMAQVMKYWNYPAYGGSTHGYTDSWINPDGYGYLYANFGATAYNWASMPNSIASSSDPVSTLIYHCGVSVDLDYGYAKSYIGSTGVQTTMRNSLINYFQYSPSSQFIKNIAGSNQNTWESTLINELINNRPIIYAGSSTSLDHVFVLDGYTKMQDECCTYAANFHVNWGWGGSLNGYYSLTNLQGFNYAQAALIGIKPASYTYPVPAQPSYISEGACSPHCRESDVDYFVPSVVNAAWYEWNITGITATGITANDRYATIWSHHYGTGTLWCRAVNSAGVAGPWQTRSITISNCLGRSEKEEVAITENQVYPNPATDNIYINLPEYAKYNRADLTDMQGKVLKTVLIDNENTIINTDNVNNGLYLIRLSSSQGVELRKIAVLK